MKISPSHNRHSGRRNTTKSGQERLFSRALLISLILHGGIILALAIGIPNTDTKPVIASPVPVNLVKMPASDKPQRNSPPRVEKKPNSPPIKPAKSPEKPPGVDAESPPQPPVVEEKEETEPEKSVNAPVPKAPTKKPDMPVEKEDKEEQKKTSEQNAEDEVQKREKQFQSVLKNLAPDAPDTPQSQTKSRDKPDPEATSSLMQRARQLTQGEQSALRAQLARCWNIMPGARDSRDLVVKVRLYMNPDRMVQSAEVVNRDENRGNPFFRAAAERALRAIRNPQCTPLKLPPDKYDQWKVIVVRFDPKEMI